MKKIRLTVSQALIRFLRHQYVERDGIEYQFFQGCFGILGHGNVAGIGQALFEDREFPFYPFRNEQGIVHAAVGYAKTCNRLSTFACTSSIGPGATNMVTGAALATINRIPVLLLPGDQFADRRMRPVLQELESPEGDAISVNDCFRPVSKYWDRILAPDQLITSLERAMRILISPDETGAVTISLPQDVQAMAFDFPEDAFIKSVWKIKRREPETKILDQVIELIKNAQQPLIIAGGGVKYSNAGQELNQLVSQMEIPVVETMAGKGTIPWDNPMNLGSCGVTGTKAGCEYASEADVVIGIGTRYTDFTTASYTQFKNPNVQFANINVNQDDAAKMAGIQLVADAKLCLQRIIDGLSNWKSDFNLRSKITSMHNQWQKEVTKYYQEESKPMTQAAIIGVLNDQILPSDIIVNASGSIPGDLHKLWRTSDPEQFHLEYGYSCMGYEIAGGLGVKMARPEKEIFVIVGDGSYLMMSQEIVTSIQEGYKLIIILIDNQGYKSIGSLSRSLGSDGFGTRMLRREAGEIAADDEENMEAENAKMDIDYMLNAASMGAVTYQALDRKSLIQALSKARQEERTTLIYTQCDRYKDVESYSWWDVPVAEVSQSNGINKAHEEYIKQKNKQRFL